MIWFRYKKDSLLFLVGMGWEKKANRNLTQWYITLIDFVCQFFKQLISFIKRRQDSMRNSCGGGEVCLVVTECEINGKQLGLDSRGSNYDNIWVSVRILELLVVHRWTTAALWLVQEATALLQFNRFEEDVVFAHVAHALRLLQVANCLIAGGLLGRDRPHGDGGHGRDGHWWDALVFFVEIAGARASQAA